jgi:hypothetical protein
MKEDTGGSQQNCQGQQEDRHLKKKPGLGTVIAAISGAVAVISIIVLILANVLFPAMMRGGGMDDISEQTAEKQHGTRFYYTTPDIPKADIEELSKILFYELSGSGDIADLPQAIYNSEDMQYHVRWCCYDASEIIEDSEFQGGLVSAKEFELRAQRLFGVDVVQFANLEGAAPYYEYDSYAPARRTVRQGYLAVAGTLEIKQTDNGYRVSADTIHDETDEKAGRYELTLELKNDDGIYYLQLVGCGKV